MPKQKVNQNKKQKEKHKANKKQKKECQKYLNNKMDIEELEDKNIIYDENVIKEIFDIYEKFTELENFHTILSPENNPEEEKSEEIKKDIKQKINNEVIDLNIKQNNINIKNNENKSDIYKENELTNNYNFYKNYELQNKSTINNEILYDYNKYIIYKF